MQDDMKKSNPPGGSRSYSTSARRRAERLEVTASEGAMELSPPMQDSPPMTFRDITHELGGDGHKFGLPENPLARTDHFKRRYDPVVEQLTKALMRHGKLSAAQKVQTISNTWFTTNPGPANLYNRLWKMFSIHYVLLLHLRVNQLNSDKRCFLVRALSTCCLSPPYNT